MRAAAVLFLGACSGGQLADGTWGGGPSGKGLGVMVGRQ